MALTCIFLPDLRGMIKLTDFFGDIYKKNNDPCSAHYATCKHYARITELTIKIGYSAYFILTFALALSGAVESLFGGVSKQTMVIYFPGISEYSPLQFTLLTLFNIMMGALGFLVVPIADMMFFVMFANVPMVPKLIKEQLNSLEEGIAKLRFSPKEVKHRLSLYLSMHKSYNE